jgi:hypothetical protein
MERPALAFGHAGPQISVHELFPEIDFTRSPELLFPFPRDLSPMPHELMVLAHFVSFLRPQRVTSTIPAC